MEICQSKTDVAAEVKPNTHVKGDSIYVDGGYAGETTKLKNDLRPGNHDIEVRDPAGNTIYRERVQVLVGKTTEIKLETQHACERRFDLR